MVNCICVDVCISMLNISPIGMISKGCDVNVLMLLIHPFKYLIPMCMHEYAHTSKNQILYICIYTSQLNGIISLSNSETIDILKVKAKRIIIDLIYKMDIKSGYKIQIKTHLLQSLR